MEDALGRSIAEDGGLAKMRRSSIGKGLWVGCLLGTIRDIGTSILETSHLILEVAAFNVTAARAACSGHVRRTYNQMGVGG